MSEEKKDDQSIFDRLKEAFGASMAEETHFDLEDYPDEALPHGTVVKSIRHDRLGAIYDAFYGDIDKNNTKIIIYTILLFPEPQMRYKKLDSNTFYVSNEYEYDIIAYLMLPRIDMKSLARSINLGALK